MFSRADSVGFVERADFVGYCGTDPHPGADSNTAKALVYVGHLVSFVRYLAEAGQGSTRDGKRGAGGRVLADPSPPRRREGLGRGAPGRKARAREGKRADDRSPPLWRGTTRTNGNVLGPVAVEPLGEAVFSEPCRKHLVTRWKLDVAHRKVRQG